MVSLLGSALFPLTLSNGASRSARVAVSGGGRITSCCFKQRKEQRKVVCACVAPPRDLRRDESSATKFNDSLKSESLSTVREPEDDSDVLIECRDVYKSFGEKHILRGVSFKIGHGEAVGIIGPSGTGKSTVLKIIAGPLAPDKGEVYIRGRKRVGLISDEEMSGLRIGLVFQSAALFDSLTVSENIRNCLSEGELAQSALIKLSTLRSPFGLFNISRLGVMGIKVGLFLKILCKFQMGQLQSQEPRRSGKQCQD